MRTRILTVAALILAATMAQAQLPPGKWWQRPEVIQELQLTREQQDRLDEAFRAAANDLIDAKASVEKLQVSLRGELDREQLRRAEIQRIAGQVSDARARLFERELLMLVDMRAVLTGEQWNRMRSRLDQFKERRGEGQRPMGGPGDRRPGAGGTPRGRRP